MECCKYCLSLPYPEVEGKIDNGTLALLMQSYGGKGGELSAISQYMYEDILFGKDEKETTEQIKGIAICEMKHFELLGEAITTFGGEPLFSGAYRFWSGSFLNYSKDLPSLIAYNINSEENAINEYEKIISCTDNDSLKRLIGRIIMDEQLHITIFENMLKQN